MPKRRRHHFPTDRIRTALPRGPLQAVPRAAPARHCPRQWGSLARKGKAKAAHAGASARGVLRALFKALSSSTLRAGSLPSCGPLGCCLPAMGSWVCFQAPVGFGPFNWCWRGGKRRGYKRSAVLSGAQVKGFCSGQAELQQSCLARWRRAIAQVRVLLSAPALLLFNWNLSHLILKPDFVGSLCRYQQRSLAVLSTLENLPGLRFEPPWVSFLSRRRKVKLGPANPVSCGPSCCEVWACLGIDLSVLDCVMGPVGRKRVYWCEGL